MVRYRIYINNVDYTSLLPVESTFDLSQQEGGLLDTFTITFEDLHLQYDIKAAWEVIVEDYNDPTVRYFGGLIRTIHQIPSGVGIQWSLDCMDWKIIIDRNFFTKKYFNKTHGEVIKDAFQELGLSDFNTNLFVEDGPIINQLTIPDFSGRQILNRLSDISGYYWDIDSYKRVIYRPEGATLAPFQFSSNPNYSSTHIYYDSSRSISLGDYNAVEVRGGYSIGEAVDIYSNAHNISEFRLQIDGIVSARRYHNIIKGLMETESGRPLVEINTGTEALPIWQLQHVVGVGSLDPLADVYWNVLTARIIFKVAPPAFNDNSWRISGQFTTRVIASIQDASAIATNGGRVFKKLIYERNIVTRDEANAVAQAFLDQQGPKDIITARFIQDGLSVGDAVNVQDEYYKVDKFYQVHKLESKILGAGLIEYFVSMGNGPANKDELAEILKNINDKVARDDVIDDEEVVVLGRLEGQLTLTPSSLITTIIPSKYSQWLDNPSASPTGIYFGRWVYRDPNLPNTPKPPTLTLSNMSTTITLLVLTGSPVVNIRYRQVGTLIWILSENHPVPPGTITITGLSADKVYEVQAQAENSLGLQSNWSLSVLSSTMTVITPTDNAPFFTNDIGDSQIWILNIPIIPITVPEATGLPIPTYALIGNLPNGISFNAITRIISGTPISMPTPDEPPAFADSTGNPQSWTQNTTIPLITVPEATGTPTPTYAVVGNLPAGISFNTNTRIISGTPTATGSGIIRIRATNSEGSDDWTVDYSTTAALAIPSFANPTGDAQSWTQNVAIAGITVPEASGNPTPTYSVVGNLPSGVAFNTMTRVISGTPTAVSNGTIRIRATNSEGSDDWTMVYNTIVETPPVSTSIRLDSIAALDLLFHREDTGNDDGAWVFDSEGTTTSSPTGPSSNSTGPYVYSESTGSGSDLPDVSTLTALPTTMQSWTGNDRVLALRACIQGDGTYPNDSASGLQIQGRDSDNDVWTTIDLLEGWPYADTRIAGSIVTDSLGVVQTIVQDGGWVDFEITIPNSNQQLRLRNIPAMVGQSFRHDAALWQIEFIDGVGGGGQPPVFSDDTGAAQSWTVGELITPITVPAATGNPTPTYSYIGSLPAGISFNTSTRTISGEPMAIDSGTITIRATNSEGSDDWTIDYTILAQEPTPTAPVFSDDTGDAQAWTQNSSIVPIAVPMATGYPFPAYAIVGNLPNGISFTPATRIISGTPTSVGSGTIRIRATNSEGSDDWTIDYTTSVTTAPDLTVDIPVINPPGQLTPGQSFILITLVRNVGTGISNATTLRWRQSTNMAITTSDPQVGTDSVDGLGANETSTETITLTAPDAPGTYHYGATIDPVTDESNTNNNASGAVTIVVVTALAAPAFADDTGDAQSWTIGTSISPITVPSASGNPTPTYAVFGNLPAGIAFNTGTRVISGTPTSIGNGVISIRATNSQGTATWTVDYTTSSGLTAPAFADDTGDAQDWTQNQAISPITVPVASGTPTPVYVTSGNLPNGISFNDNTRIISGTPTEVSSGTITIIATNSEGTDDWTVDYTTAAATSVTVNLTRYTQSSNYIGWTDSISIGSIFSLNDQDQELRTLRLAFVTGYTPGVYISILGSNNRFTAEFEASGRIIVEASDGEILEVMIANADMTEIYQWTPTNVAEVNTFALHVQALANHDVTLTLTLDPSP